ncbi:MAG TPA: YbaK/EbsC family protein [Candidatus Saccharimonadales bacterium]|nr:YbaK/EbsC family protein [Candidatus Saccharimonadales bacterium]
MRIGKLTFKPIAESYDLVARPIKGSLEGTELSEAIFVTQIDPKLADTASFCREYDIGLDISTNCLIVEAKRADKTWYAACLILATDMADVNGLVRRQLDARKISFAPMDTALLLSKMEYGGITPLGLPADWPILIDEAIMKNQVVVVGGGVRVSKIAVETKIFRSLPNATIMKITKPTPNDH